MATLQKLLALTTLITLLIMAMLIAVNLDSVRVIGWHLEQFAAKTFDLLYYCLGGAAVMLALGGLTAMLVVVAQRRNEDMRQRDGSFPLQRLRINGATVIVDPNKVLAPALVVSRHGIAEVMTAEPELHLQHAVARARVAVAQALAPGDNAISSRYGSQYKPSGRSADRTPTEPK